MVSRAQNDASRSRGTRNAPPVATAMSSPRRTRRNGGALTPMGIGDRPRRGARARDKPPEQREQEPQRIKRQSKRVEHRSSFVPSLAVLPRIEQTVRRGGLWRSLPTRKSRPSTHGSGPLTRTKRPSPAPTYGGSDIRNASRLRSRYSVRLS